MADIAIRGNECRGYYGIVGVTDAGREWMSKHVPGTDNHGFAASDDTSVVRMIADAAVAQGLTVAVNDEAYTGQEELLPSGKIGPSSVTVVLTTRIYVKYKAS